QTYTSPLSANASAESPTSLPWSGTETANASTGVRTAPEYTNSPDARRSGSVQPDAATSPSTMGMMSVLVVPMSMSRASGRDCATTRAVAAQFAAATSSGASPASATVRNRPSTAYTQIVAPGNAAATASSTKCTPSRLVRNICDSSAVIVTACMSASLPPASLASSRNTFTSAPGSCCNSNGREQTA